ncbi:hypothetical protein PLESTB_000717100 [Pleodorina starrii]|uniref:Uncharacterized protein n=1 Tax=Pleodorina starrii TaxID=330485 RepID=A0A9W6BKD2_9CHLO|nr:hypothetical protein PLESTM_001710400 [Pleodorina starrii]GLC53182.1 hypothetical protein PLESTB_000717100 [Pleodorina starrii]GLC68637.1 hypothetical protein PLESTF_000717700 [Pleodorina starrii]
METILAQFVTWNNVINDYAVNVQNLLAPVLGAMVAEVAIHRNVDAVQLDLVTPFNKQRAAPQHHILVDWIKNQELREADMALAQARLGLMDFMAAQADTAATAGRPPGGGAGAGRYSGSNTTIVDVPRLARHDTPGAATLALLTEAPGPGGTVLERSGSGRAGATAEGTASPGGDAAAAASPTLSGGADGLPSSSGPERPPGTAESASTDASDSAEAAPQTLTHHLQHFNGCVASLQQHLGPNFGVYFHVTPAVCAVRGRCAYVRLMRHTHPAKLAASVNQGSAGETKALLKPNRTVRFSRAPSAGEVASAAAAAIASSGSRGPSRVPSQSALRGAHRASAAPDAPPPPPPGSAAAILGEDNVTPVTLVDVIYSGITDAILRAERSVAVVGNDLARLFERYEPPLSLVEEPKHCRKLKTLPVAREYVEANRKIQQLNAVLFKLAKAVAKTAWIYSTPLSMPDGSLGDVAQMVCEAIRRVADTTWAMCKRHLDSVHIVTLLTHHEPFTITPRLINDDATFRFELDVVVDQSLLMTKTFPDCLPPMIRSVWDSLLALAAVVQESRTSLTPLRGQYQRLHEEVREFYNLAPEAAKARKLSIAEAAGVARVITNNLAVIYEAEQVFDAYSRNVQRIVDAYTRARTEIKADLQLKLAELTTKLPRSIVKPSFSPEMLALMRSSVNPTELAASMTLALTANNMDRTALTVMQDTLAIGAVEAQAQAAAQVSGGGSSGGVMVGPDGAVGNSAASGGGAVAALGGVGIVQQQQQQFQQFQMQQAAAAAAAYGMYSSMQAPLQSTTTAAAGVAAAAEGTTTAAAAAPVTQLPKSPVDAPDLLGHGTNPDYAAQLAMAQAYGYAYNNPYAAYAAAYGASTLGSIGMGVYKPTSTNNLLPGATAANGTAAAAAAPGAAAATGNGLAGAYQSAGYDPNTISMLAQMGYGGFAVGSQQQQQQQMQQLQQMQQQQQMQQMQQMQQQQQMQQMQQMQQQQQMQQMQQMQQQQMLLQQQQQQQQALAAQSAMGPTGAGRG